MQTSEGESGIYRGDLTLVTVREEMDKFVSALKASDITSKDGVKALDTDFLLI